jgi:hypothetical protein
VRFTSVRRALLEGRTPTFGAAGPLTLAFLAAGLGIALLVHLLVSSKISP